MCRYKTVIQTCYRPAAALWVDTKVVEEVVALIYRLEETSSAEILAGVTTRHTTFHPAVQRLINLRMCTH